MSKKNVKKASTKPATNKANAQLKAAAKAPVKTTTEENPSPETKPAENQQEPTEQVGQYMAVETKEQNDLNSETGTEQTTIEVETKYPENLDEVKAAWLACPTFKLEEIEGLEGYKEELLQFRAEMQEKEEIKALQHTFIEAVKQQLKDDAITTIPEYTYNLFTEELNEFKAQLQLEKSKQRAQNLFEDFRKTFETQKEQMPSLSLERRTEIVSHYYTDDNYAFIRNELPEMEGLECFLNEMKEWATAEFAKINQEKAAIKFKETVNMLKPALIDKYACEAMHRLMGQYTTRTAENYKFIAVQSFDIAEAMVNERIARGYAIQTAPENDFNPDIVFFKDILTASMPK